MLILDRETHHDMKAVLDFFQQFPCLDSANLNSPLPCCYEFQPGLYIVTPDWLMLLTVF